MDWRVRFGIEKYFLIGLGLGIAVGSVCILIVRIIVGLLAGDV